MKRNTAGSSLMIALTLIALGWNLALGAASYLRPVQAATNARGYLPVVLNQTGQPAIIHVPAPEGVAVHFTNPQVYRDRTGVIFAATRANSSIGGVVWKIVNGSPVVVLQLGPVEAYANGELVIWPDGKLYYLTVPCNGTPPNCTGREIVAYEVTGWTP